MGLSVEGAKKIFARGAVLHLKGTPQEYNLSVATGSVQDNGTGYVTGEMEDVFGRIHYVDVTYYEPTTLTELPEDITALVNKYKD